jgi:uncharacterized protein (TIRG00374 family)
VAYLLKSSRRRWFWLGVGTLVLVLIFYNLSRSAEWREFSWQRFWLSLTHARPGMLLAALAATYASYLVRAYRWKCFLDPIKKGSLWTMFAGQILGFSSIYLVGRPGEFVRPAYIARKEKVSITSMVAIWLLERIYDTVSLVLLFAAALYLAPLTPEASRAAAILVRLHQAGLVMFVVTALIVVALVAFRLRAEKATSRIVGMLGSLGGRLRHRLEHFLLSFAEGLRVIQNWRELTASLVSTALLWFINASVLWLVFRSVGGELGRLSWLSAGLTLFFAVLGLMVQFPGIGGGYQVGIILALTELFSIAVEPATGAAILVWIVISVPCLVLGVILLVHEGLTFKKLEVMAEEERAVVAEEV